jgi:hypothetical protein
VRVSETEGNENQNRRELKTKRKRLYELFLQNPMHTRLAVEIKALDDQLAEPSEQHHAPTKTMTASRLQRVGRRTAVDNPQSPNAVTSKVESAKGTLPVTGSYSGMDECSSSISSAISINLRKEAFKALT